MEEQSVIEQRLNPLTGNVEWVVVRDGDSGNDISERSSGQLQSAGGGGSLAHTQYLDMLNDDARNKAYDEAIRKVVKPSDHVLDIGAGTGLLSMMVWRAMNGAAVANAAPEVASNSSSREPGAGVGVGSKAVPRGRVTACESYLPMVRLARKLLRANGVGSGVRLVHKRSDDMKIGVDMPSRADILVSEILDSELLGEGLIPTLRHAHEHLLKPDAKSVPHRATIYGQLVECDYLWRRHDLAGVEAELSDGLLLAANESRETACGWSDTLHVNALANQLNLVSEPFEVFEFEFCKSPPDHNVRELEILITKTGIAHALISWWVLQLDKDGLITYTTAPEWITADTSGSSWRDHWKQCIWRFPGRGARLVVGDVVRVTATHDAISVKYAMKLPSQLVEGVQEDCGQGEQAEGSYHSNSVTRSRRVEILGDMKHRHVIKAAVTRAVQAESSPCCLIVDDSVICTLSAALGQPNAHVMALLPGLRGDGVRYMNKLAKSNAINCNQIQVIGKKAAHLSMHDLHDKKVEVLIAEPYFVAYEDLLPWRLLRFWSERTSMAPFLVDKPKIIPYEGILRGVAVFLPDLWNSRKCLTSVEGFDLSQANELLGACGELPTPLEGPLLPCSLWQCGQCKKLTDDFSIMNFDFSRPMEDVKGSVTAPVSSSGICHAIVLWMDWVMNAEANITLSTGPFESGPTYWKQGIKLLSHPLELLCYNLQTEEPRISRNAIEPQTDSSMLRISAAFSSETGDIELNVSTIT